MQPLAEHPSPLNELFDCSIDLGGGTQNSSAPIGATSGAYPYSHSSSFDQQHQRFTTDVLPSSLELTTPYTDWVCAASAPTESSLAIAGPTAALPKSLDTGVVGSFGPTTLLPIPFTLQHTTSVLNEIPAAQPWGVRYAAETADGAAVYGGTPDLAAVFAEALPAGYDVGGTQVGLDEFINAL